MAHLPPSAHVKLPAEAFLAGETFTTYVAFALTELEIKKNPTRDTIANARRLVELVEVLSMRTSFNVERHLIY